MVKKNLDNLFQEKFKNFSKIPDEHVWEQIKASLDKKKKHRVILPIWWKFAGVAALLAILFYILAPFGNTPQETPTLTEIEKSNKDTIQEAETQKKMVPKEAASPETAVVEAQSGSDTRQNETKTSHENKVSTPAPSVVKAEQGLAVKNNKEEAGIVGKETTIGLIKNIDNIGSKRKGTSPLMPGAPVVISGNLADKERITMNNDSVAMKNPSKTLEESTLKNNGEAVVLTTEENERKTPDITGKKSIFEAIQAQETAGEEEETTMDNAGKWSVGANVAPVYFSSIGQGSPIHSSFASNSKSGELNLSYGLSVAYKISKKLRLKSGIHKVAYGYHTNDVEFSSSFEASATGQIPNIDYTLTSENLFVSSKTSGSALRPNIAMDAAEPDSSRDGVISQEFGYLEVPMELNYAIVDKRLGVVVIGGVSSLFLVDNSVALSSGQLTTEIGKANNLNTVNFSTNIGFGVNYNVTPKIQLNIEPVFKYQLNTFSNISGDFQPFSVGVYSGLQFKF